jgi:hypothetical protein
MRIFLAFILCSIVNYSCQNLGTKNRSHFDTFSVAKYTVIAPNGKRVGPLFDSAILAIRWQMKLKDTTQGSGFAWVADTPNRYGRISDDTLRGPDHRPIYDTAHKPLWHYVFYTVPDSLFTPIIHAAATKH